MQRRTVIKHRLKLAIVLTDRYFGPLIWYNTRVLSCGLRTMNIEYIILYKRYLLAKDHVSIIINHPRPTRL